MKGVKGGEFESHWNFWSCFLVSMSISIVYALIHWVLDSILNTSFFAQTYGRLSPKTKSIWKGRIIAVINAFSIGYVSIYCLFSRTKYFWDFDLLFFDDLTILLQCMACGFFIFHFFGVVILSPKEEILHVIHHSFVLASLFFSFYFQGKSPTLAFIIVATVHAHAIVMLKDASLDGTLLYTINGVILSFTWFIFRILPLPLWVFVFWKNWQRFAYDSDAPMFFVYYTIVMLVVIGALNCFWFVKIIKGMVKKFRGN